MALTGLEIYKHLPKTNCKKCGYPTCLAFAMKLAQKGAELSACPDISEEAKQALEAASRPPIRLVALGAGEKKFSVGNEVVMFRHEKTFYHEPGILVKVKASAPPEEIKKLVAQASAFGIERVGKVLKLNGFAVQDNDSDVSTFVNAVSLIKSLTDLPLALMSTDPAKMEAALQKVGADSPLIYAATKENATKMAELALKYKCPLAVYEPGGLGELASVVEALTKMGLEDVVLDPGTRDFGPSLVALTQLRRLALKKNFRLLGYPIITFPGEGTNSLEEEAVLAGQHIAKYAGIIVLDHFTPGMAYPLLTLRQNIYTDPQKPIQVTPGVYPIGEAREESPVLVTTNFSLTYFVVMGEVEGSGLPSWLIVADSEGLSVLTAWAAGKFDAERIAKAVKSNAIADKVNHRKLIIPGFVASLSGELEEELSDWEILVGPREAVDIPSYFKKKWLAGG